MYASPVPRYSNTRSHYGSPTRSYSPTKYGGYVATSSAMSYDDRRHHASSPQYYAPSSPPMKTQHYHRSSVYGSSALGEAAYYSTNQGYVDGTTYYNSSSSTTSSSQDGYYADELDELDEYALSMQPDADPEMTTVPTIPTPLGLSKFEQGKTPSGRVVITSSNQTVEFFSCVVNLPTLSRNMYGSD